MTEPRQSAYRLDKSEPHDQTDLALDGEIERLERENIELLAEDDRRRGVIEILNNHLERIYACFNDTWKRIE